ncbi:MAG: oxygen-dependent coproporphyrinogen oxidase [Calditrichaeota bacterium]|nr:MAG: oxygen-dependent coproporphyrinogen oxidase [Calditrichota bacterium]
MSPSFEAMEALILRLQSTICAELAEVDGGAEFVAHPWRRETGGGGLTRVIQQGKVFEKGGVNTSSVYGELPPGLAEQLGTTPGAFAACGLSIVIHPRSPRIPTIHLNIRYFQLENGQSWYAGGMDLTPYYPHPEDFVHFHRVLHQACEAALPGSYQKFKAQCDRYFYLPHRGEMRGVGGVFYDHLDGANPSHFELNRRIGEAFLPAYLPIVLRRKDEPFTDQDREFQLIRRGRYVEFNLLYDRGTAFGLQSGGRVESIFISLPLEVKFPYNWQAPPGSPYAEMTRYYQPRDWLDETG